MRAIPAPPTFAMTRAARVLADLERDPYMDQPTVLSEHQREAVASRNEAARLRNIAALSKELAEPMSKRRARLARKYDGGPWQEWPKGGEDEP